MIGSTVSHYRILDKLGEGGMGVVYKALDQKLDRSVAMKFLSGHLATEAVTKARFIQEAKVVAALHHPNILAVHEIDEQDGSLYYVMEYVEGQTLKSYITSMKGTGIPMTQALDWTDQIARALKTAHDKQVVHRDIKPENIMLAADGTLKIMDFGIAQLKSSSGLTTTGTSMGTLSYMSPEQAQGVSTDLRTDIWSLGVVLFELLTGERPFRAEHDAGLLYLIMNEEPPPPSEMDKKIPRQVDPFVRRMLEKDRAKRYADMGELLEALAELRASLESAASTTKAKAIAVLPFGNISQEKESDYFSDGLTEELIASLSKLKDIRLVPRATSMQYKGTSKDVKTIGRELGTRYILSGSVRKYLDNLRITVELIDVDTDTQLWAETYKGKLEDVFDIQEKVSEQIVEALMVKLTPKEKTVLTKRTTLNAEAFDCNLRARDLLNRRTKTSVGMAIQFFQKAIELDPRYAAAYAGLGESYGILYRDFDRKDEWLDRALEVSLKAIMYDATLSEAYASLALAYFGKDSLDESLEACQKAILLDPNNVNAYWILARIYHTTDRDTDAVIALEKALELNPEFLQAYVDIVECYERLGDTERYNERLRQAIAVYPKYLAQHPDDTYRRMAYAVDLTKVGRMDEARTEGARALELSVGDPIMMYYGACLYSRLLEKSQAVEMLKNAVLTGYRNFEWIKRDPDFENIRDDPGYIELMKNR